MNGVEASFQLSQALTRVAVLECDLAAERAHADRWQKLAGRYDEIRDWLRVCDDSPEGRRTFYRECSKLIFPDANV